MGKDIELAILFADVVGSTRLFEAMGDLRARDMIATCIDVMREATEQHNGTVIKTIGDEVMSTFPTADDALNAAGQMQRQIAAHTRAAGRGAAGLDPHRLSFWPGGARGARCLWRQRAHGQSHDQPGQGGADHHDLGRPSSVCRPNGAPRYDRSMSRPFAARAGRSRSTRCSGRPRTSPACCPRSR